MYAGFNLQIQKEFQSLFSDEDTSEVRRILERNKMEVYRELDKYLMPDGNLDGELMQKEWFPEVQADVFISHSHSDFNLALQLAAYLKTNFGLTSFIDSTVWGHADDLLKDINEDISKIAEGRYRYQDCNYAASHVHMMLSVALNKMMDKCECLFFLNTPNSVKSRDAMNPTTGSAWIYSEIANSRLLRIKEPVREGVRTFAKGGALEYVTESKSIQQPLDLDHLYELNYSDLHEWNVKKSIQDFHSLDILYSMKLNKKLML